ncbi:hypothetical protein AB0I81_30030 [Nonomuraea sp. NPDC050404]|uniref:hypothetical protein n=1 Tax=Nonomuraea sp. NPDC050404 TaxID=3155783 RepID=UPI00340917E1
MSGFQVVASLVGSLDWPVAVVVAVVVLRRPLAAAMSRAKRFEAAGVAVELAEAEQARAEVEKELEQAPTDVEVDELVKLSAKLGFHLARLAPDERSAVVVDRSGQRPVVRSVVEERCRMLADLLAADYPVRIGGDYYVLAFGKRVS